MLRKLLLVALCGAALSGCVQNYAEREVAQGAAPGSLVVLNAPADATIEVDGRPYGTVGAVAGPLTPGRHQIVVEAGGRQLHSQSIFMAAGARAEVRVP